MTQKEALDILKLGHNVLLTGPAGSGKTFLLNEYIEYLKKNKIGVGITASTGIAATHINGRTIHSFTGIGIKDNITPKDIKKIQGRDYLQEQFLRTQVLVIDEVSMLHDYTLDMIDEVCRAFKEPFLPFGGMQVLLCGDFFQLPPVSKGDKKSNFIVASGSWRDMDAKVCYLTEQHRHTDDLLSKILNSIRSNKMNSSLRKSLGDCCRDNIKENVFPTKIYTTNADVDSINNNKLSKIKSKEYRYYMTSEGDKKTIETLKKYCLAPEKLILKKGAVVMFIKNNFGKGYVNGTSGTVIDFSKEGYPIIETKNGKHIKAMPARWELDGREKEVWIEQVPLRLAWAITVHKSQGMSLDAAEIDLSKTFESGMGYVALSRVRRLDGLKLNGFNELALRVSEEAIKIDKELKKMSQDILRKFSKLTSRQKKKSQKDFLKILRDK